VCYQIAKNKRKLFALLRFFDTRVAANFLSCHGGRGKSVSSGGEIGPLPAEDVRKVSAGEVLVAAFGVVQDVGVRKRPGRHRRLIRFLLGFVFNLL